MFNEILPQNKYVMNETSVEELPSLSAKIENARKYSSYIFEHTCSVFYAKMLEIWVRSILCKSSQIFPLIYHIYDH